MKIFLRAGWIKFIEMFHKLYYSTNLAFKDYYIYIWTGYINLFHTRLTGENILTRWKKWNSLKCSTNQIICLIMDSKDYHNYIWIGYINLFVRGWQVKIYWRAGCINFIDVLREPYYLTNNRIKMNGLITYGWIYKSSFYAALFL